MKYEINPKVGDRVTTKGGEAIVIGGKDEDGVYAITENECHDLCYANYFLSINDEGDCGVPKIGATVAHKEICGRFRIVAICEGQAWVKELDVEGEYNHVFEASELLVY